MGALQHTALWGHVEATYKAMQNEATSVEVNGKQSLLWEGRITELMTRLRIPMATYNQVMKLLSHMGCIENVQRGARYQVSKYVLWEAPTPAAGERVKEKALTPAKTKTGMKAYVDQRIADIQKSMGGLDTVKAMADLQEQIDELRGAFNQLADVINDLAEKVEGNDGSE